MLKRLHPPNGLNNHASSGAGNTGDPKLFMRNRLFDFVTHFSFALQNGMRIRPKQEEIMSNKSIFKTVRGMFTPKANTVNEAGGLAYKLSPKQALAQYAATGCFSHTFYVGAAEQLDAVLALTGDLDAEFIAKTAIFARENGHMKDMPAFLVAVLSAKDKALFERIFPRVIDNGKMLRNFVQIMRSGAVGRKSLGSLPKRMVREWFEKRASEQIFKQSVGQSPSIADILKMVHPKPVDAEREA